MRQSINKSTLLIIILLIVIWSHSYGEYIPSSVQARTLCSRLNSQKYFNHSKKYKRLKIRRTQLRQELKKLKRPQMLDTQNKKFPYEKEELNSTLTPIRPST